MQVGVFLLTLILGVWQINRTITDKFDQETLAIAALSDRAARFEVRDQGFDEFRKIMTDQFFKLNDQLTKTREELAKTHH